MAVAQRLCGVFHRAAADPDPNAYRHGESDTFAHADDVADPDAYANPHTDPNPDANSNSDTYPDAHSNAYADTHSDSDTASEPVCSPNRSQYFSDLLGTTDVDELPVHHRWSGSSGVFW